MQKKQVEDHIMTYTLFKRDTEVLKAWARGRERKWSEKINSDKYVNSVGVRSWSYSPLSFIVFAASVEVASIDGIGKWLVLKTSILTLVIQSTENPI